MDAVDGEELLLPATELNQFNSWIHMALGTQSPTHHLLNPSQVKHTHTKWIGRINVCSFTHFCFQSVEDRG